MLNHLNSLRASSPHGRVKRVSRERASERRSGEESQTMSGVLLTSHVFQILDEDTAINITWNVTNTCLTYHSALKGT